MTETMRKVLILDDDEAIRESLAEFFEDRGWQVLPVATAEEAFDIVEREEPNSAIVDIRLPGMDGNAFIRAVCRSHPRLSCVVCTGSPEYRLPDDVAAMSQVSENVFSKPVKDMGELEETLRLQIDKSKEKMSNNQG